MMCMHEIPFFICLHSLPDSSLTHKRKRAIFREVWGEIDLFFPSLATFGKNGQNFFFRENLGFLFVIIDWERWGERFVLSWKEFSGSCGQKSYKSVVVFENSKSEVLVIVCYFISLALIFNLS